MFLGGIGPAPGLVTGRTRSVEFRSDFCLSFSRRRRLQDEGPNCTKRSLVTVKVKFVCTFDVLVILFFFNLYNFIFKDST